MFVPSFGKHSGIIGVIAVPGGLTHEADVGVAVVVDSDLVVASRITGRNRSLIGRTFRRQLIPEFPYARIVLYPVLFEGPLRNWLPWP